MLKGTTEYEVLFRLIEPFRSQNVRQLAAAVMVAGKKEVVG